MNITWLWLMLAALPVVLVAVAMRKRTARRRVREQIAQQVLAAASAEAARIVAERRVQTEGKVKIAADALQRASREAAQTVARRQEAARRVAEVTAPPPRKTREQAVVLVADDSKIVRVKASRLLAKHGYRVWLAEDGLDAARQIAAQAPDLLITDVEMPGMDGFELTRHVRGHAQTSRMPIIMITAADAQHRETAALAGANALLGKPYADDELIARIDGFLGLAPVSQPAAELVAS